MLSKSVYQLGKASNIAQEQRDRTAALKLAEEKNLRPMAWLPISGDDTSIETKLESPEIYASKGHLFVASALPSNIIQSHYCRRARASQGLPPIKALCGQELPDVDGCLDYYPDAPRGVCKRCLKKAEKPND